MTQWKLEKILGKCLRKLEIQVFQAKKETYVNKGKMQTLAIWKKFKVW